MKKIALFLLLPIFMSAQEKEIKKFKASVKLYS